MLPIHFAPLHGLTDAIFRTSFSRYFSGVSSFYAPFITTVNASVVARSHLKDILPFCIDGNVVPQILGKEPGPILQLARTMNDLGYDHVNWNLGCPFVKVTRKRHGSGLLPHAEHICRVLDNLIPNASSISLKVRLGLHNEKDLQVLLPLLDQYPLKNLVIHPRTADQGYTGTVNVETFNKCLSLTRHPVIFNGDIRTYEEYCSIDERFKARVVGVMIGRGLIANPFLAEIIRAGKIDPDYKTRFWAFHDELICRYLQHPSGKTFIMGKIKALWYYWQSFLSVSEYYMHKIRKSRDLSDYLNLSALIIKDL